MAALDRDEIKRSLALLETSAATDTNVKAAADALKRALREADADGLLTTTEAAAALGVRSINIMKRWVKTGYIHGVQRNGRTMIPVAEIKRIRDDDIARHRPVAHGNRRLRRDGCAVGRGIGGPARRTTWMSAMGGVGDGQALLPAVGKVGVAQHYGCHQAIDSNDEE